MVSYESFYCSVHKIFQNDIGVIMDTWTAQMGYPVINVTKSGSMITLSQKRFLLDPQAVSK